MIKWMNENKQMNFSNHNQSELISRLSLRFFFKDKIEKKN